MNFTWKSLAASQTAFENLKSQISRLSTPGTGGQANLKSSRHSGIHDAVIAQTSQTASGQISNNERTSLSVEKLEKVNYFRKKFTDAINDDLNTAVGLSVVWEVIKSNIPPGDKYDLIMLFDEVLGLDLKSVKREAESVKLEAPKEINDLVKKREQLRNEKKWEEADEVRIEIEEKGYIVEDSKSGPKINKINPRG